MTFSATRYEKIFIGLVAFLLLIAIVAVCVLFTARKYETEKHERIIEVLQDNVKREIEAREAMRSMYDSTISYMMKNGNQATAKARSNKVYYENSQKKIDEIERNINSLNRDELRRDFSEFK